MRQGLVNHIALVVFLKYFPAVGQLLSDLRYRVEVETLPDLGGLPVVIITAPLSTFLPANDFILQVTQLRGSLRSRRSSTARRSSRSPIF